MKTRNVFIGIALVAIGICQSCNIATTVHFNKNYSGSYTTVLDLSDLISMAGMFDTTGTMDQGAVIEKMRYSLDSMDLEGMYNGLSGIRDADVNVSDEGVVSIGFKFDNIESLNASFKALQDMAMLNADEMGDEAMDMLPTDFLGGGNQTFTRSGKTITCTMSTEEGMGDGFSMGDEGDDMDMLSSMIDYTVDLSFDRKVKSVDAEGLTIVEKGSNIVRTRVDLAKFMKDGKYSLKVNTK